MAAMLHTWSIIIKWSVVSDTKIVTSVYSQSFEGTLDAEMINKIKLTEFL
jgi:hypothetical protein